MCHKVSRKPLRKVGGAVPVLLSFSCASRPQLLQKAVLTLMPRFSVSDKTDASGWGHIKLSLKTAVASSVPAHVFEGILAGFLERTRVNRSIWPSALMRVQDRCVELTLGRHLDVR